MRERPGAASPHRVFAHPSALPRRAAGRGTIEFLAVKGRSCYRMITLTNDTQEVQLFKVLTTAPARYRVKPASGSLDSGASIDVHLVLTPQDTVPDDLALEWGKDKFQIKSLALSHAGGSDASTEAVSEAWKAAPADAVEATRLRCSHAHAPPEDGGATSLAEPAPSSPNSAAASPAVKRASTPTAEAKPAAGTVSSAVTPRARDAGDDTARWLAATAPAQLVGSLLLKTPAAARERLLLPIIVPIALLLVWYADRLAAWMLSGSLSGFIGLVALAACYGRWLVGTPPVRAARPVSQPGGGTPRGSTPRRSKKAT